MYIYGLKVRFCFTEKQKISKNFVFFEDKLVDGHIDTNSHF
jgi:hypothetical protein